MALVTHFLPSDTQAEIVRRYYVADLESDLPTTGFITGDLAFTKTPPKLWVAFENAWTGQIVAEVWLTREGQLWINELAEGLVFVRY